MIGKSGTSRFKSAASARRRANTNTAANDPPEQSEWRFDELESMGAMPRCEVTGANVDLHLVAYRDPDTEEWTARILGADFRHLVRRSTTLSVPVSILSLATLRQLESQRKIPLGTRAAKKLREWFRHEVDRAWQSGHLQSVPREPRQASLELAVEDPAIDEEPFRLQG
ncbi:MAG: hypothetical protein KDN19_19765 [Verrucomicrobiae bacterium]|nr:hypothetical protein [Verrucomicrobiae bacterium]